MSGQGSGGNVIAALCSIFLPGLGQLVQGRIIAAILFFILTGAFYFTWIFWFVGAIFHLWAIIDAAKYRGSD